MHLVVSLMLITWSFDIDPSGNLNKTTGKSDRIIITNDKGRLSLGSKAIAD